MEDRKKIKWEIITLSDSGKVLIPKGAIEVRFFFNVSGLANQTATINGAYVLDSFSKFTSGVAVLNPYELILINNAGEEDVTEYYLKMVPQSKMTVLYKYYINA
jgi:hypothetical protein